ncbi:hypothetical protein D3C74_198880 [compost metagenome]
MYNIYIVDILWRSLYMVVDEISVKRMNILHKRPVDSILPQFYMNLIPIFLNQNLPKPSLILSNWSLEIMLKSVYIKEKGSFFPPHTLSFEILVDLTRCETGIDIDSVSLIQSVKYLANYPNQTSLQNMSSAHLQKIVRSVDELLCRLSPRATDSTVERYSSIF